MGTFIDIGIAVIILIAVIVGLAEGFSRQFSHPLCGLVAIFGAIGLTAFLFVLISKLAFYSGLETKAIALFKADFYTKSASNAEGLSAILSSGYLRILTSSSATIWHKMAAMGVTTLGEYFGKLLVKIVSQFLIWIVLYLAIKYLLFGIRYLMTKIARVVVFKSIDRIFGLVWSLALTYIIVIGLVLTTGEIVLAKFFPTLADLVSSYIAQTSMLKFFHNTNVIGSFVSSILHWPLLTI